MSRSIRSRVILGIVLWTLGLLAVAHVISFVVLRGFPETHHVVHVVLMLMSAAGCLVAGFVQLRGGLSPFQLVRSRLTDVRNGRARQVEGRYPAEIQLLVTELNALLDHHDQVVRRAQAKAGDLAHGLKTPLAILQQEADRAASAGHDEMAQTIAHQVERMRRQVDYHLAHARAAASGSTLGARCAVADSAEGLARTLGRLHADRGLAIDVLSPRDHVVRVERQDLDEMLGNLIDNACKWARSRVVVASDADAGTVSITVDDDGPGLEASQRDLVLQRGARADESAPGSGLGLAIVRDLAALYGGSIALDRAPQGGVRALLRLPRHLNES